MNTSRKHFKGFSCCFRQWKAYDTHCRFLHGYSVSFIVEFQGELDERNWVWDFGGMKRAKKKINGISADKWFKHWFDHTTIIAENDPELDKFIELEKLGVIQLRVIDEVGAEKFAEFVFKNLDKFVRYETNHRVTIKKVTVLENENNSATYEN